MKWIPVSEQLPKDLTFVLVTVKTDFDIWVEIMCYLGNGKFSLWPGITNDNVTHWMSKPEPAI
jgi:Protein of unknown function (DUF551)